MTIMIDGEKKYSRILFIIVALFAFIYVAVRAYLIEITHDEAYSFFLADTNYFNALVSTANTHWLNTFFIKLFSILIGTEPWAIRIHSVLAFPVFAYFLYRFFDELKSFGAGLILISLFFLNRFSLEYFSLARGYGLCLAFLTASIFYAYKSLSEEKTPFKYYLYSLIFGILAIASNYTVFFQFCGIFGFLFIMLYLKSGNVKLFIQRKWLILLLLFFGTCIITITNLLMIKYFSNDLQFGGDESFFTNTLYSIISFISNLTFSNDNQIIFKISSFLLFTLLLIIFIYGILKSNIQIIFFSSLFFFQFLLNYILFFLFKTPFPLSRTALVLYPAIALSIVWFVENIKLKAPYKLSLALIVIIVSAIMFFRSLSFDSSYEWRNQSEVKIALNYINENIENNNLYEPKILVSSSIYSVWKNYYKHFYPKKYGQELIQIDKNISFFDQEKFKNFNYLITTEEIDIKFADNNTIFKLMKIYPKSQLYVYHIKKKSTVITKE